MKHEIPAIIPPGAPFTAVLQRSLSLVYDVMVIGIRAVPHRDINSFGGVLIIKHNAFAILAQIVVKVSVSIDIKEPRLDCKRATDRHFKRIMPFTSSLAGNGKAS